MSDGEPDVQWIPGVDYCDSYLWPNLDPDPRPFLCGLAAGHDGPHEAHTHDGDELSEMPARTWNSGRVGEEPR